MYYVYAFLIIALYKFECKIKCILWGDLGCPAFLVHLGFADHLSYLVRYGPRLFFCCILAYSITYSPPLVEVGQTGIIPAE